MRYTHQELLVISAVIRNALCPWDEISTDLQGLGVKTARLVRDDLIKRGVLALQRIPVIGIDGRERRYPRLYVAAQDADIETVSAWLDGRGPDPLPPPLPRVRKRRAGDGMNRPPGKHQDPADRILEAVLRNPGAAWRDVRALTCLRGDIADEALRDLIPLGDDKPLDIAMGAFRKRNGRPYTRKYYKPNENNARVIAMRKRYGIPIPDPSVYPPDAWTGGPPPVFPAPLQRDWSSLARLNVESAPMVSVGTGRLLDQLEGIEPPSGEQDESEIQES